MCALHVHDWVAGKGRGPDICVLKTNDEVSLM